MAANRELIKLDNIVKRYGELTVLDRVSLTVYEGEFLALLGPSGCGKTSLLGTIGGFLQPTHGSLTIDGRSILNDPPNRRPVNTVFQNYALFPHLTVHENVAFGPRRHGAVRKEIANRVQESLSLVGMEAMAERYPSELSGGQQQRVALARAIINEPKVLLLDEPMAALDLKLRKRMQIELKRLQERLGITFIIVTHDQEEALVMANRIAVMSNGRIEQVGTGEEIYANPVSRFVAGFVGEANLIDCLVDAQGNLRSAKSDISLPYSLPSSGSSQATMMLRPECLCLNSEEARPGYVTTSGQVREIIYAGPISRIYLCCDIDDEIVITQNTSQSVRPLTLGERVNICWRHEDARILSH
ncbi:MAG: ABC transporter ATP-binding protein [Candidimonas sp.]|nr:MAG: ABC transporter ATP-binding protein [Candidimonas sp.]TAM24930.1 MAG: ABC transporter ATP-binding protein [Candidimonas sp.]TAM74036.1 MAG: ABC transporter ATP-binding protein [Candidimonas sp.]